MNKPTHRRLLSVTFLALMVFIGAILNLLRLGLALRNWAYLSELLSSVEIPSIFPAYLAVSGLVWGLVGLLLAWGIWKGESWAPRFLFAVLLVYSAYYWIDRLFLSGYPQRISNWPFALSVNLLILLWSVWVMTRQRTRYFFGEAHE